MGTAALQMSLFSPKWQKVGESGPAQSAVPYCDPFLENNHEVLDAAGDEPLFFGDWNYAKSGAVGVDVESFANLFIICFKRFVDGTRIVFERSARRDNLDRDKILMILNKNTIISFNGEDYDLPIIFIALGGATTQELKRVSDKIVFGNTRPWEIARVPRLNHIDLMEPNPSIKQGLKMLNGRLHGRYMVDLPFPHDATLMPREMNIVTLYCMNDLDTTQLVYYALREPLELRVALGRAYRADFRSKSDSQVGETIVKKEVERVTGRRIEKVVTTSPTFMYKAPLFLQFEDEQLRTVMDCLRTGVFSVDSIGRITSPAFLKNLQISLGGMIYSMGIGGIHSTEAHRALRSDEERFLLDVDVASQYPTIIMTLGLYPPALGPEFLKIYGELIKDRLAAKAAGDKVRADGGRIALNGVYGKLGSPHSSLYAPNLLIAITLTGQLAILMLIERAEAAGIPAVSANTDGVVFHCPHLSATRLNDILAEWEKDTGFTVERTPYRAIYNSSVNTYIAIREDGKVKRKGYIADPWQEGDLRSQMMKNPSMTICSEALVRYLTQGVSIERTIRQCTDPRMFVTVVKVTGGAQWRGYPLGRAVRYYWSMDGDPLVYVNGGKKVSKTDGAKPLPELTDRLPPDIDFLRYCEEAARIAGDLGISNLS